MAVPCDACQRPVNEQATRCPHCGARRDDGRPASRGLGGIKMTAEEARALLVVSDRSRGPEQQGTFATLILPHEQTRGAHRVADLALAVLGLPLIAAGAPVVLMSRARTRDHIRAPQGELVAVGVIAMLGAPLAWSILHWLGLATGTAGLLVVVMLFGLIARALIRQGADKRSRALSELDTPPASVPPARVVRLAELPGLTPLAGAEPERTPADDGEPGVEPRLLR